MNLLAPQPHLVSCQGHELREAPCEPPVLIFPGSAK